LIGWPVARPTNADLGRSRLKKVAPAYLSGARPSCAREEWRHTATACSPTGGVGG